MKKGKIDKWNNDKKKDGLVELSDAEQIMYNIIKEALEKEFGAVLLTPIEDGQDRTV